MDKVSAILKEHRFFKDLKQEYLELLIGCAAEVNFTAGDVVIKEGGPADNFYLIKEGLVAIEIMTSSQRALTIQTIQGGDILGWSWLIPPYKARFNCRAIKDTQVIALDGRCLRGKCETNHDLGYELLKRLAQVFTQRLEATRWQLINAYGAETKK
ncbi:MAG: cyclic nucleotide-binding domain-containing protein [Candidatus Omnitrophota bacterium]